MQRILITGAGGFTGRYLASALSQRGEDVIGVSHRPPTSVVEGVAQMHACDLGDAVLLRQLITSVKPDKIIHLAAIAYVAHGSVEDIYRTNILGTRNLLDAASALEGIDAVLLGSSANIYGNRISGPIRENAEPNPANDYAVSKISMEYVARLYAERLPITIARPFNYTGVGQSINFLIPKIVDHVYKRKSRIELGNLNVSRDFSDVRDVARSYLALLDIAGSNFDIFNICSGKSYSLKDILSTVKQISGHEFIVDVNPALVRISEVETLWGDRGKLEAATGLQPLHRLEDTLRWMLTPQS